MKQTLENIIKKLEGEVILNKDIVSILMYLEGRNIHIEWKKYPELNIGAVGFSSGESIIIQNQIVLIPILPLKVILFTNKPRSVLIDNICSIFYDIKAYDEYKKTLIDDDDVLEIKKLFECSVS